MPASGTCRILLLGGGYALCRVATQLAPESFVITSRTPDKVNSLKSAGYTARVVNLDNPTTLQKVLEEFPSIQIVIDSVPQHSNLANTIGMFQAAVIKQIIYLSTTGVFGSQKGEEIDEHSPCYPLYPGAQARLMVEDHYRSSGIQATSLRISGIYGPGRGIGNALRRGTYSLVDGGMRWTNRIQVDDLARAIVKLIDFPTPPPIVCVSDDSPTQAKDVVDFYCDKFSLPYPHSISLEQARALGMYHQLSNQRVSNSLLRQIMQAPLLYSSFREGAETEFA